MVWLFRSPNVVGREGSFWLLKLFLHAFAAITGEGGEDSTNFFIHYTTFRFSLHGIFRFFLHAIFQVSFYATFIFSLYATFRISLYATLIFSLCATFRFSLYATFQYSFNATWSSLSATFPLSLYTKMRNAKLLTLPPPPPPFACNMWVAIFFV